MDLTARIVTSGMLDASPPAFQVTWILWDSDFRSTDLQIGDQITAINGTPIVNPDNLADRQKLSREAVGQVSEAQFWAAQGAKEGDKVRLDIRRRNVGGAGWSKLTFEGALRPEQFYRLPTNNEPALAPNGPEQMQNDGFDSGWSSWYEDDFIPKVSSVLGGGWERASFSSRYELQMHLNRKPRVDYLLQHYPGEFANSVKHDWDRALEYLQGKAWPLTAKDLDYRRAEDERVGQVSAAAQKAWADFQQTLAGKTIPPFPALNPVRGDIATISGKYLVLPAITNRNWISQADRTFFTFGSETDGWYYADAEAPPAQAMLLALQRYRRMVAPNIQESYEIAARIIESPRLLIIGERGYYCTGVEIVAALVGQAMFVDVTAQKDGIARFADEESFTHPGPMPPDSATPREVMESFFDAVKTGDMPRWKALFADWSVDYLADGRAIIYPHDIRIDETQWEDSRRTILDKVYDLHVVWTGDPSAITTGTEFRNAPRIEEVEVEIEHVGLFDGEYRVFSSSGIRRMWKVQRVDAGPWRISSIQPL